MCELEVLTQEEQDVDFRRQIADKKYAEVSLEVKQLEVTVEGLLREITIKQADVDKIKGQNSLAQERFDAEKSKQRKLEDALFDRETTIKVQEGDLVARESDLEGFMKSSRFEEEIESRLIQEKEALTRHIKILTQQLISLQGELEVFVELDTQVRVHLDRKDKVDTIRNRVDQAIITFKSPKYQAQTVVSSPVKTWQQQSEAGSPLRHKNCRSHVRLESSNRAAKTQRPKSSVNMCDGMHKAVFNYHC
ncbi:hypothetical protein FGO68_gene6475 [Halteria grandinella]|uniref:Uncharacterized protein n=1 Tax=Halteria grandinella TaxID=5974 RepID=A0A8J8P536_HALGN|nr:hypothetical protein FGO68_gene6475 [Halteria grandinella]